MDEFYTQAELAKLLHCNSRQIGKLRRSGLLSAIRIGHGYIYRQSDIDTFWNHCTGMNLSNDGKILLASKKSASFLRKDKHSDY
jgi:hypothetical protein